MPSIRLDPKHGVNPMLMNCFFCNEAMGVALMGQMKQSVREALSQATGTKVGAEAPRQGVVFDKEPCSKCKDHMEQGVILISVDEEKSDDMQNPYRTGGWVVVSEDFIKRVFNTEMGDQALEQRVAFVTDGAWDELGLPRNEETASR